MFIGHHAVGFAAKRFAPRTSLGWLMAAPLALDLIWPLFLLSGSEHVRIAGGRNPFLLLDFTDYPWSHSLALTLVWGTIFGGAYWLMTRYVPGAIAIAAGVASHWALDFITHRPDLPIYPEGPKVGLGLWYWPAATVIVEVLIFVAGLTIYVRMTRRRDRIGTIALVAYVALLLLIYVASWKGVPPESTRQLASVALAAWLFPLWAAWLDRHREVAS